MPRDLYLAHGDSREHEGCYDTENQRRTHYLTRSGRVGE